MRPNEHQTHRGQEWTDDKVSHYQEEQEEPSDEPFWINY